MKTLLSFILGMVVSALLWAGCSVAQADYTACWTPPTENTDGTPLTDLDGYKLWAIPVANTYGTPMILPVTPQTQCAPDLQEDCHFIKPTGQGCYFKYWPSPAGDWKMKMKAFNAAGVDSADSAEVLFTLIDADGDGNPGIDEDVPIIVTFPGAPDIIVECPLTAPGECRLNSFTVTRKGFYTISGPDGVWLTRPDGATRQVTTRDEAYEWISRDGRGGKFIINPPPYEVSYE